MKKFTLFAVSGFLFLATIPPVFAKGSQGQAPQGQGTTPLGFSTLLCMADALLDGAELPGDPIVLFGGQVMVDDLSPVSTSGGFSTIKVRITHGKTYSDHTITFIDTDSSGTLNCGDTIVSVS